MLFLSLLFILAGVSLITAACIMITYTALSTGGREWLPVPRNWPPDMKKWARFGGYALGSILLGMLLALIGT